MSFPYTSFFEQAMDAAMGVNENYFAQVPEPSGPAPAPAPSPAPSPSPAPAPEMASPDNAAWARDLGPLREFVYGPQDADLMAQGQGALDADVYPEGLEPQVLGDFFVADPQLQHDEAAPADFPLFPNEGNNLEMDLVAVLGDLGHHDPNLDLFGDPIVGDQPSDDTASSEETASCAEASSSPDMGAQAQERPAPQTVSELTGMRLPNVPVQYAAGHEPTPSPAGAAEALDTPVQMPAPEHVDEPLPDAEGVPAENPLPAVAPVPPVAPAPPVASAPPFASAPVVMSPPMNLEVDEALIHAALNDPVYVADVLASADALVAQMNAWNNNPVPEAGNVPIPQNNMWNGQGMQPQLNGTFRPSSVGNIPMPQGFSPDMAGQAGMEQMVRRAQNQGPHASGFNPSLPSNMPTYGMYPPALNSAQPGVQAVNPLNPHWGIQNSHHLAQSHHQPNGNMHYPAQSQPQLNGNFHQAGQPITHPLAPNSAQRRLQAGNPPNPHSGSQNGHLSAQSNHQLNGHMHHPTQSQPRRNRHIHQARQPPMLSVPPQQQVPHSSGQVQPAPFVNAAMHANAQVPVLNAPRQMAPANQMVNGMGQHQSFQSVGQGAPAPVLNVARNASAPMNGRVQFPTVNSPEVYRSFSQRPNSKPGCQLRAYCIACKTPLEQFGVRCQHCKCRRSLAPNVERRSCIACRKELEPGTNRIFCDKHHEEKHQYTNRENDTFRKEGICTECRKVDAEGGVTCKNCRRSRNKAYNDRKDEAVGQGICQTCREPNPSRHQKCDACREEENAKRRKRPRPEKDDGPEKDDDGMGGKRPRKA
ncbi:hypothetical protein LB507_009043 [Fusarium sp. FIESC RH6]|nr:hypothetical protein LB507_009043 [Fusarium sp. FIESC RH6]